MPKNNFQQKSTPDARIRHQQVGAERRGEERAALLKVRTRPKCPEGNWRELLWDTNLNSGTAKEREKINGPNTLPAVCRTKGLSKSRGASRLQTGPSPPEAGDKGEGKGANSAPEMASPYHTANRPPVSNQRLPEILDGRHPPGGSWLNTRRMHPTGNWVWGNWVWGRRGEKAHRARGECARPAPGCLILLGPGKAQNTGAIESTLSWSTQKLEPHAMQGMLHIEQPGAWAV